MNTVQSNLSLSSSASTVEPTEPFILTLNIEPGYPLELLYESLTSSKENYYQEAADALAHSHVSEYTDCLRRIETLNEMIGDIVQQLGCAYTKLHNLLYATDLDSRLTESWKQKEIEFANRFGFSKE